MSKSRSTRSCRHFCSLFKRVVSFVSVVEVWVSLGSIILQSFFRFLSLSLLDVWRRFISKGRIISGYGHGEPFPLIGLDTSHRGKVPSCQLGGVLASVHCP
jgi:hypothetical protein